MKIEGNSYSKQFCETLGTHLKEMDEIKVLYLYNSRI